MFFRVPPGVVFDPTVEAEVDGGAEADLEAAFVLVEPDPERRIGVGPESAGVVESVALSAEAEGPMTVANSAEAVVSRGLRGDRYECGAGTFSNPEGRGYDLTLVEAEALEDLAAGGVKLEGPPRRGGTSS